jgi:hypothetical protein
MKENGHSFENRTYFDGEIKLLLILRISRLLKIYVVKLNYY